MLAILVTILVRLRLIEPCVPTSFLGKQSKDPEPISTPSKHWKTEHG